MYLYIILSTAQCRKTVSGRRGRSTRILRAYRTDGEYHRCFIAEPGKLNVRRLQEMRELSRKDTRAGAREMHANTSCAPHEQGRGGGERFTAQKNILMCAAVHIRQPHAHTTACHAYLPQGKE